MAGSVDSHRRAIRPPIPLRWQAYALVSAIILVVLASCGLQIWASYRQTSRHGETDALNWARAIDENVRRSLRGVDRALQIIGTVMAEWPGAQRPEPASVERLIDTTLLSTPHLLMIVAADADGQIVLRSGQFGTLADRVGESAWFREARDATATRVLIGQPARDPLTNVWGVPVVVPVMRADGAFSGAALAVLNGSRVGDFFRTLDVGPDGVIAVTRNDGTVLFSNHDGDVGRSIADRPLFRERLGQAPDGVYCDEAADGVDRVTAYRTVDAYPLVVSVGLSQSDILSEWRTAMIAEALLAIGAVAAIGGLSWLAGRQFLRVRDSERRFRLLAENATDVIWLNSLDGVCRYVAPSCRRVLGRRPDELISRPMADLVLPADRETFQRFVESLQTGAGTASAAFRMSRDDGTAIWLETVAGRVRESRGDTGAEVVAVSRDISEQVRFTRQLQEQRQQVEEQAAILAAAARELDRARHEADTARTNAEQANRAKSQFLASMSHELRTPLNAILGFSELLREQIYGPVGDPRYRDYAGDIHDSGTHLLHLINDILDLAKIEAGKMHLCLTPIGLPHLFQGILRLVKVRAQEKGLTLVCEAAPDLPVLQADERAVKQILFNLLSNAVKFTPRGGRVTLSASSEVNAIKVAVVDTGDGIPADQIERVFRPFEQLHNEYGIAHDGTGLGLPLVQALVELHHGTITIDSAVGVGTTVTVRLPLDPAAAGGCADTAVLGSTTAATPAP